MKGVECTSEGDMDGAVGDVTPAPDDGSRLMRAKVMRGTARCRFVTGTNDRKSPGKSVSSHTPAATKTGSYSVEYSNLRGKSDSGCTALPKKRKKRSAKESKGLPLSLQQEDTVMRVIAATMAYSGRRSSKHRPKTQCPLCGCEVQIAKLKKHGARCPKPKMSS
jgi:hypothetical protein